MKVVVFGGTGTLGFQVVSRLATRSGNTVIATYNRSVVPIGLVKGVEWVTFEEALAQVRSGTSVSRVVNAIGCTRHGLEFTDYEEANVNVVRRIVAACETSGTALLHVSTDCVFPEKAGGAYYEHSDRDPETSYGLSKLIGECLVTASKARAVIMRTSFFGPNYFDEKNDGLFSFVLKNKDKEWTAYHDLMYNGVTSIEAAHAVTALLSKTFRPNTRIVHISRGNTVVTKGDVTQLLSRQLGGNLASSTRFKFNKSRLLLQSTTLSQRVSAACVDESIVDAVTQLCDQYNNMRSKI